MPKYKSTESRNKQRLNYYNKHRIGKNKSIRKTRYTNGELFMIRDKDYSDVELSKILDRSVQAIQITRTKIKNGFYNLNQI